MAKKDISNDTINTASRVYANLEKSTTKHAGQATADDAEKAERIKEGRTQGRKGCKMGRYNVAFTPENKEYIRIMAKAKGQTMTGFVNDIIAEHRTRKKNQELMQRAKDFIKDCN